MQDRIWIAFWAVLIVACSQKVEGPSPEVSVVAPDVVCNDQLETWLELTGARMTPSVLDALTDDPAMSLPTVWITRTEEMDGTPATDSPLVLNEDPTDVTNERVRWARQSTMSFMVDEQLSLTQGVYDIGLRNPTGEEAQLSRAFAVVPPPTLESALATPICTAQYENGITLTGTHFLVIDGELPVVQIGDVSFTPTGTDGCTSVAQSVRDLQYCTTLYVTVGVDDVGVGDHDVVVTNPSPAHCMSTEVVKLRVLPPPTVTGVEPQPVCVSQSDRLVEITGTGFLELSGSVPQVRVGDVGVVVESMSDCEAVSGLSDVQTCETLMVRIAEGMVDAGVQGVVVTNPESAQCASEEDVTLTVVPPPTLVSVTPQPICNAQDARLLLLEGTGFLVIEGEVPEVTIGMYMAESTAVTASGCQAVEGVSGVQSCTELSVLVPAESLPAGVHDVQVTNPDPAGCVTVEVVPLTVVPPPEIVRLVPGTVCLDESNMMVTVEGTGFLVVGLDDPEVTVGGEVPVDVVVTEASCTLLPGSTDVWSCTEIVLELAQNSLLSEEGPFEVVVTNPDPAGCVSAAALLTVVHAPEIYGVSPAHICTGGGVFAITGADLEGISAYLVDSDGGRVDPTNVSVEDGGTTAQIAFAAGLRPDTYDLHVLGLGGCGDMLGAAITVSLGPTVYYVDPPVVYNGVSMRATVYASGMTSAPGGLVLVPSDGGDEELLTDVVWDAAKPNRIQATIPAGLTAGAYDLFILDVDGCDAILGNAVTVVSETTLALLDPALIPEFGEAEQYVAVNVLAIRDAELAAGEVNFQATPRVYLSSADLQTAEPLRAVVFETSHRLSAVVPPLPEGEYDLVVVNPDGTVGFQPNAYRATPVPPPEIDDVQPSKIEGSAGQEIFIIGRYFYDSAVTVTCSTGSTPVAVVDPSSTDTELRVTLDASGTQDGAVCVVRVSNTANDTYDDWSALSVTNPAGNMSPFSTGSALTVGRRAPGVAVAQVTRKSRYLYVVGGDAGTELSAMTSVEAAPVDALGSVGAFRTLATALPQGRTLATAQALGRFLYLPGGAGFDSEATDEILRAEILQPFDAPDIVNVDLRFAPEGDGLEAGSWTYQVSAVLDEMDAHNPGGESLVSESVTLYAPDVPDGVEVELTWRTVWGADTVTPAVQYRVYRTQMVNGGAADIRLLAVVTPIAGDEQSFVDMNPDEFADDLRRPLAVGDLGEWHVVDYLMTPRAAYGLVADAQKECTSRWYIFGGWTDVATESLTYEVVDVSSGEIDSIVEFTAGGTISARRHHSVWIANGENATVTLPACHFYLYTGPGLSAENTVESTVRVASYIGEATGELETFAQAMGAPAPVSWYGYAAFHSGSFAYSMGGHRGASVSATVDDASFGTPPTLSNWNNAASNLQQARMLFGYTRFGSFNYLVGGVDGAGQAMASTELNVR